MDNIMTEKKPVTRTKKTTKKGNDDARTWAVLCHLSGFAGIIVPFGYIIAPLIIWMLKRDEYDEVETNGREALNFQISITIYYFFAGLSMLMLVGFVLLPAVMIFHAVCMIIAALKTREGIKYRYPLTLRFL